jgi:hypothetical protein
MKTLKSVFLILGLAVAAPAAPCPTTTTLDVLIGLGAAGCTSQDFTFSSFQYSLGDASSVMATLVLSPGPNSQNVHGWSFQHVGGAWHSSFTLSYNVVVTGGTIVSSKDQIDSGAVPNTTTVNDIQTKVTLTTDGLSNASQTQQATYPGAAAITTNTTVTLGASGLLFTYNQLFIAAGTAPETLQVNYAANLSAGDSYVNLTNTGIRNGFDPAGGVCANVYVFDPSEEMVSCCACYVTPDGLKSLSVKSDLVSNTLTPGVPGSVVIKILGSLPGTGNSCNAATLTSTSLEPGIRAWRTTLHQNTAAGKFEETENVFLGTPISDTEFAKLTTYCGFIQSNGSGFGICKSCRLGGLGGAQR